MFRCKPLLTDIVTNLGTIGIQAIQKRTLRHAGKTLSKNLIQLLAITPCRSALFGQLREWLAQLLGQLFPLQINTFFP